MASIYEDKCAALNVTPRQGIARQLAQPDGGALVMRGRGHTRGDVEAVLHAAGAIQAISFQGVRGAAGAGAPMCRLLRASRAFRTGPRRSFSGTLKNVFLLNIYTTTSYD